MVDSQNPARGKQAIWILVDHSSRESAFDGVGRELSNAGIDAEVVTITEVLGTVAKGAFAGGKERLLRGLRVAVKGRGSDEDLVGAVRRAKPDAVVVTDARYVRALSLLETFTGSETLLLGVMADYNLSSTWAKSACHGFVVVREEARDELMRGGVSEERILIAGPPVQSAFCVDLDRSAIRGELGFGQEAVVLVRGECLEPAHLEKVVFQATLLEQNARFVFHHNSDALVASTLREAADRYGLKAVMFGRVNDLERFVAASDLVLTAPGDPLLVEMLALNRPLSLLGKVGSVGAQVEFLVRHGSASHVEDPIRLGSELDRLILPDVLTSSSSASEELSAIDGDKSVADALRRILADRTEWLKPDTRPTSDDDLPIGSEGASGANPFETIGDEPRHPGGEQTGGTQESSVAPMSRAQAKEELAALILEERGLERKLQENEKQQTRWRGRLDLARQWNEADLESEAQSTLRIHLKEGERLRAEFESIGRQKKRLKSSVRPADASQAPEGDSAPRELENRFRSMEVNRDLDSLKDRMEGELGD
jgi:UDP-N-acetylglucosamine:LPS N-acetylglucosamine transferase